MDYKVLPPSEEWITYIAKMWLLGNQISKDEIGQEMDSSLDDLNRLQAIIDTQQIAAESTQELQALGFVFGKVFVNDMADFDWWVIEDEYGTDACVRYQETSLLIFPQTMILKCIEDDEEIDVLSLYQSLKEDLERIITENYSQSYH